MTEVIMPKMGDGMEEGTLLEWLKKEGDSVKSGEIIGSIQTDKATIELESPSTGVLQGLLIKNGETVPVGVAIATVLNEGEKLPANWGSNSSEKGQLRASKDEEKSETKSSNGVGTPAPIEESKSPLSERLKASPLAKKIAQEKSIDLSKIVGTGPGGRVVEKDVLAATTGNSGPSETTKSIKPNFNAPRIGPSKEDRIVHISRLKKITGERTQQAKLQAPHIYVTLEVDVEKIRTLRAMFEEEGSTKPSINDFAIRACVLALRDFPQANASITSEGFLIHGSIHIGVAVATEDGLTVPVIKNADLLSLKEISSSAKNLVQKAKDNKLSLEELSGSTFSISNMGMLNVDSFAAIINVPNAAIIAIGSARKKVVANDENEIEVRERMNITGSFDHRVMDGADAAKFMNLVKTYLENPTRLLR